MTFLKRYLIPRLFQYVLILWLGITIVFLIPRLTPNDPVMAMIGEMRARGSLTVDGVDLHETPNFFCRLDEEVVYWKRSFWSGLAMWNAAWDINAASWKPDNINFSLPG